MDFESRWLHTREIIATIINVNRDPKKPAVSGKELVKLSFDKVDEVDEKTLAQIEEENAKYFKSMKTKFGGKIKKTDASK